MTTKYPLITKFILENTNSRLCINAWIPEDPFNIYLRMSFRYIDNTQHRTIEIANVYVVEESERSKKHFTKLLEYIESNFSEIIYVENVFEDRFKDFFIKRGYIKFEESRMDMAETPNSYYLPERKLK